MTRLRTPWGLLLAALLGLACSRGAASQDVLARALENPVHVLPTAEAPEPVGLDGQRRAYLDYVGSVGDILLRHQAIDREAEAILSSSRLSREESAERLQALGAEEDALYRELSGVEPPDGLNRAHSPWLRALIRYSQAFQAAAGYYETASKEDRSRANDYFRDGLELLAEGYDELVAALQSAGISPTEAGRLVVLSRQPGDLAAETLEATPPAEATPTVTPTPLPPPVLDPIPTPLAPGAGALEAARGAALDIRVQRADRSWVKGTGSVVGADGLTFLTAFHVVGDLASGTLFGDEVLIGPQGDFTTRARVAAMDTSLDLAVLRILADQSSYEPVPMGDAGALELGETVHTLSYPAARQGSLTTTSGVVLGRYRVRGFAAPLLATNAEVSLGSSGGVVVNRRGELVGIITSRNTSAEDLAAIGYPDLAAITLFVPIEAAGELLATPSR